MAQQRLRDCIPAQLGVQERFHTFAQRWQNRLQVRHQHAEQVDAHRADRLQVGIAAFLFRDNPRRLFINIAVSHVRQRHNFTDRFTEFAAFPRFADDRCCVGEGFVQRGIGQFSSQYAIETLVDKARVTGSQVDDFVDDIRVDALHEVFQIQVDVIDAGRELRRVVIAQAVGVKMVQPGAGLNKGAARFRHLRAVHRYIAVNEQVGRFAETAAFQHGRPEQAVEVNDIFTDEMV